MATYINDKTRLFKNAGDPPTLPTKKRSEARLKEYHSATDTRAWSNDEIEQKEYMIDLMNAENPKGLQLGKYVPIDVLIDTLMANKNADIKQLKEKLDALEKLLDKLDLTPEQRKKINDLKEKMSAGDQMKADVLSKQPMAGYPEKKAGKPGEADGQGFPKKAGQATPASGMDDSGYPTKKKAAQQEGFATPQKAARGMGNESQYIEMVSPSNSGLIELANKSRSGTSRIGQPLAASTPAKPAAGKTQPGAQSPHPVTSTPRPGETDTKTGTPAFKPPAASTPHPGDTTTYPGDTTTQPGRSPSGAPTFAPPVASTPQRGEDSTFAPTVASTPQRGEAPTFAPPVASTPQRGTSTPQGSDSGVGTPGFKPLESSTPRRGDKTHTGDSDDLMYEGELTPGETTRMDTTEMDTTEATPTSLYTDTGASIHTATTEPGESRLITATDMEGSTYVGSTQGPDGTARDKTQEGSEGPDDVETLRRKLNNKENEAKQQRELARKAIEQLEALKDIMAENNKLKEKLRASEDELNKLKTITGCTDEIAAMEKEIETIKASANPNELDLMKKELVLLKKYCEKLKNIQDENKRLKHENDNLKGKSNTSIISKEREKETLKRMKQQHSEIVSIDSKLEKTKTNSQLGEIDDYDESDMVSYYKEQADLLREKLEKLKNVTKERDKLKQSVTKLENSLRNREKINKDVEVFKERSKMLDNVLEERDSLHRRLSRLKGMESELQELKDKAARVDELEKALAGKTSRPDISDEELEALKYRAQEADMLRLERDRLNLKLGELGPMSSDIKLLEEKANMLEKVENERDDLKGKLEQLHKDYENLKQQLDEAKSMADERDAYARRARDLECIIADQEGEINKLVSHIERLSQGQEKQQDRMKKVVGDLRNEIDRKESLITQSEEQLANVQDQLLNTITEVASETTNLKKRIADLEAELRQTENQLEDTQKELNDMKDEENNQLVNLQSENNHLQQLVERMRDLTDNDKLIEILKKSKNAVRVVAQELGKQFQNVDPTSELLTLRNRVRQLENELPNVPYSCISPGGQERVMAENKALRKHSSEIQEFAKDRIKDLLDELRRAKDQIAELERQLKMAQGDFNEAHKDNDNLKNKIKELKDNIYENADEMLVKDNKELSDEVEELRRKLNDCKTSSLANAEKHNKELADLKRKLEDDSNYPKKQGPDSDRDKPKESDGAHKDNTLAANRGLPAEYLEDNLPDHSGFTNQDQFKHGDKEKSTYGYGPGSSEMRPGQFVGDYSRPIGQRGPDERFTQRDGLSPGQQPRGEYYHNVYPDNSSEKTKQEREMAGKGKEPYQDYDQSRKYPDGADSTRYDTENVPQRRMDGTYDSHYSQQPGGSSGKGFRDTADIDDSGPREHANKEAMEYSRPTAAASGNKDEDSFPQKRTGAIGKGASEYDSSSFPEKRSQPASKEVKEFETSAAAATGGHKDQFVTFADPSLTKENADLKKDIERLNKKLESGAPDSLVTELRDLREQLAAMKKENERLNKKLLEGAPDALVGENKELRTQLEKLKNDQTSGPLIDDLKNEITRLKNKAQEGSPDLAYAKPIDSSKPGDIEALKKENDRLVKKIQEGAPDSLISENNQLRIQIEKLKNEQTPGIGKSDQNAMDNLLKENEALKKEIERLNKKLQEGAPDSLVKENNELRAQIDKLKDVQSKTHGDVLGSSPKEIDDFKKEIERLNKKLQEGSPDSMISENNELRSQIEKLKKDLKSSPILESDASKKQLEKQAHVGAKPMDDKQVIGTAGSKQAEAGLLKEIEDLKKEIDRLNKEIDRLNKKLLDGIPDGVSNVTKENDKLKSENENLEKQKNAVGKENSELKDQLEKLKKELSQKPFETATAPQLKKDEPSSLNDLKAQLETVKKENEDLKRQNLELKNDVDRLNSKLQAGAPSALVNENNDLKEQIDKLRKMQNAAPLPVSGMGPSAKSPTYADVKPAAGSKPADSHLPISETISSGTIRKQPGIVPGTTPGVGKTGAAGIKPDVGPAAGAGIGGSTRPGVGPDTISSQRGAATVTKPGVGPGTGPGTRPGDELDTISLKPGAAAAAKPGAGPLSSQPGAATVAKPGAAGPAAGPGTRPGIGPDTMNSQPGAASVAKPGVGPADGPGTRPGIGLDVMSSQPGAATVAKPGVVPAAGPGTRPGVGPDAMISQPDATTVAKPDIGPADGPGTRSGVGPKVMSSQPDAISKPGVGPAAGSGSRPGVGPGAVRPGVGPATSAGTRPGVSPDAKTITGSGAGAAAGSPIGGAVPAPRAHGTAIPSGGLAGSTKAIDETGVASNIRPVSTVSGKPVTGAPGQVNKDNEELKREVDRLNKRLMEGAPDAAVKENNDLRAQNESLKKQLEKSNRSSRAGIDSKDAMDASEKKDLLDLIKKLENQLNEIGEGDEKQDMTKDDILKKKDAEISLLKKRIEELEQQLKSAGIKPTAISKEYADKLKDLEKELEKQKRESMDAIKGLKSQYDRDVKNLHNKYNDGIQRLQASHEELFSMGNKDLEREINELKRQSHLSQQTINALKSKLGDKKRPSLTRSVHNLEIEPVIIDDEHDNFRKLLKKILKDGIESLSFDELQFIHTKVCDATAKHIDKNRKRSDFTDTFNNMGVADPDFKQRQKLAQSQVAKLQLEIALERERLEDLKKTLDVEKITNSKLAERVNKQTMAVSSYMNALEQEQNRNKILQENLQKEKEKTKQLNSMIHNKPSARDACECTRDKTQLKSSSRKVIADRDPSRDRSINRRIQKR